MLLGKTTIVNSALEQLVQEKYQIERMVTYTTRPMRKNVSDHFIHCINHNIITITFPCCRRRMEWTITLLPKMRYWDAVICTKTVFCLLRVYVCQFRELKAKDHFFEVTEYNTNFYGSPRSLIDRLNDGNSFIGMF